MKGKLIKKENKWFIRYCCGRCDDIGEIDDKCEPLEYSLHPEDVAEINEDMLKFDNLEARILANSNVKFEIIGNYAKLIKL